MLTFSQIRTMYPRTEDRHLRHLLVEYVQCEILDSLFKQPESVQLSFIGGTAIRIMYGGNRFSEDLDFDNFGLSFDAFRLLLDAVVADMRIKGFEIEFRFSEKMAYHCYIKFPAMLHASGLAAAPREKLLVCVDTLQKEKIFDPEVQTLDRFDLYRDIRVNPLDIILAQKIITILERKREKGRDLYDASVLWGRVHPNMQYLCATIGMQEKDFWKAFFARCETLDLNALAVDVEPFLVDAHQADRVRTFVKYARNKVNT